MNLILFGPPGAGKGTQAQYIVKNYNYFQLSTGDLLRNEIKRETELGKKIDIIISRGNFVSDEIVNTLIRNEYMSSLQHAADMGIELCKAEIALKYNLNFIQDKDLKIK